MKKNFPALIFAFPVLFCSAQSDVKQTSGIQSGNFIVEKSILATPVKNQAVTGTCWAFSTTSLLESQALKKGLGSLDISEMFTVRNVYIEKAKNYILRQGHAQFGEGGLGHDLIRSTATYGAVPENVYSGLNLKHKTHNHQAMITELKYYLDSLLKYRPVPSNWMTGFEATLDGYLGAVPADFNYNGKKNLLNYCLLIICCSIRK